MNTTKSMKVSNLVGEVDPNGVQLILAQLQESVTLNSTLEEAAKCGHAVFPMDPPKTEKREEDLAMAVLSFREKSKSGRDETRYLMVRRPSSGLLAGQW